ncbi:hypothetical protein [Haliangium ochraceum]|uniref:Uncharacterized protein n=1 Tax=Haliangium ochraceum (strain DSM 14365 / JCM 11303 / SMP-2) TaxID=502025 RepID=D0LY22_HALO1|nr:hypothetical protein [Haliangium ochraceum]ACY14377.1 hypothetical protein Hoch_1829 [Haliangium ochraceum DSM 14365]
MRLSHVLVALAGAAAIAALVWLVSASDDGSAPPRVIAPLDAGPVSAERAAEPGSARPAIDDHDDHAGHEHASTAELPDEEPESDVEVDLERLANAHEMLTLPGPDNIAARPERPLLRTTDRVERTEASIALLTRHLERLDEVRRQAEARGDQDAADRARLRMVRMRQRRVDLREQLKRQRAQLESAEERAQP